VTNSYEYDGDGRRVKKSDGTRTTVFVYDGMGKLIAEYTNDQLPPAQVGGGTSYLTDDALGSIRVVTGSGGQVKSRRDYLPFGEEISSAIEWGARSSIAGYGANDGQRIRFTGKERDDGVNESGYDYFLARYYSGAQGRFTSPDEFTGGPEELFDFADDASSNPTFYADLTDPQSLNKYQYCFNNPLNTVDPDGHQGLKAWFKQKIEEGKQVIIGGAKEISNSIFHDPLSARVGGLSAINQLATDLTGKPIVPKFETSNKSQNTGSNLAIIGMTIAPTGGGKAQAAEKVGAKIISLINKDKTLVRLAKEAGKSAQGAIDKLTTALAKGNLNPGSGTKSLFGNILYARTKKEGARVFFRKTKTGVEILAKADKHNEQQVIDRLTDIYGGK
jgi:RHS repeat-associated protein